MNHIELDKNLLTHFGEVGGRIRRTAQVFESWRRYAEMLRNGEQLDKFRCVDIVQAYRLVQTWNYVEDPKQGRRLADEVKRWQTLTIRRPYTGVEVPLLELTEPMAANLEAVHAWFDSVEID